MWRRRGNLLDIASRWTPCRERTNSLHFTSCDTVKQQQVLHRQLSYSYTRHSTKIFLVSMCLLHTVPYVQCDQRAEVPRAIWEVDHLRRFGSRSHLQPTDRSKLLPDLIRQSKQQGWNLLDVVSRRTRGGTTERILPVDRFARSIAYWLGALVAWQGLTTFVTSRDDLFEELATKLLSAESAKAVKTVHTIITQFSDHGVIDVFKLYPPKDVIASILALAKLQRVVAFVDEQEPGVAWEDRNVLQELAHYAVFANAAYGWKMDLAFGGRINRSDLQTLLSRTGIEPDDVVHADWESKTHRPAFFIVRDHKQKKIVLCIRGTLSANDVLTDLCCTGEVFETGVKGIHKSHHGMLEAARGVSEVAQQYITDELDSHPDYSLVLVGHSLGAGVASVLGSLWDKRFPDIVVYGFGMPCVGPLGALPTISSNTISVIGEGDPFSRLSLGHIADLSMAIAHLCEQEELRVLIALRTDGPLQDLVRQDLDWCMCTMNDLRTHMKGEKMFPPGRILYMKRSTSEATGEHTITLRRVPPTHFQDLRLHPRMLDISRHVPALYETLLRKGWSDEGAEI